MTFSDILKKARDGEDYFPDTEKHELADDLLKFWDAFHEVVENFKQRVPDTDNEMYIMLMKKCDETAKAMVDTAHHYINNDQ